MPTERRGLLRILGPFDGAAVSIGVAVGVGIFRAPGEVATYVHTSGLILLAWLLGGVYAFLDAQVLAELSAMMPRAGGWYAYIHRAYGPFPAFLYGWSTSLITYPGSVAALAVPFSEYLGRIAPGMPGGVRGAACVALVMLTGLNAMGLRVGRTAQNGLTALKLAGLLGLGIALLTTTTSVETTRLVDHTVPPFLVVAAAMGLALRQVLWSYDGYADVVTLGEEMREPSRNVPRAIAIAVGSITFLYLFLNVGLLEVLGEAGLSRSMLPAADAARIALGGFAETFIVVLALVTILDSMNAQLLSGPRITFAMARDGLFFDFASRVTKGGTPIGALFLQAGAAVAFLVVIPDFDKLVSLTILVIWLASAMNVIALFLLRRRDPAAPRPFRVLGYPWTPAILLAGSGLLLLNMVVNDIEAVWKGLAVIGAGAPIYWIWMRARRGTARPPEATS